MPFEAQPMAEEKITYEQYMKSGCPLCKSGEKRGYILVRTASETLLVCSKCGVGYTILTK